MSEAYGAAITDGASGGWWRSLTATAIGLSVLSMLFAAANVLQWITTDGVVLSVPVPTMYGAALVVTGAVTVAAGLASALGLVETNANERTGVAPGFVTALFAFVATGLVLSQTVGLGTAGWLLGSLVVGLAVFPLVALGREDLGSTLPWGGLAVLVGVLFLTDVFAPGWRWSPQGFGFAFTDQIVVPGLTFLAGLLAAWSAAKAYEGFGARGRQLGAYLLIGSNAFFMLSLLALLVAFVVQNGAGRALQGASLGPGLSIHVPFLMQGSGLGIENPGVLPAIVGTFWLVVGAVVISVPLGVGAAVFLAEYAERGPFTAVVDVATDGLWSTPSIVYGLFGYAFMLPRLSASGRSNILAGMLVLGFMLIPLVLITSREAINSVPDAYRDASVALGVNRWQTIRSVVLPAAVPGIITGVILGVGRIAGETAPILLVATGGLGGSAVDVIGSFRFTSSPPFVANDALLSATNALPYQVYAVIEHGVGGQEAFGWATALVLLVVVMFFYAIGIATRMYFQRKLHQ
ncbi:MAG: phosphate ABC transporter permease PstA [Haloarculaceae archaeon]